MAIGYIFFIVILGVMFWFQLRKAKEQQKQRQALMDNLRIGQKIVTIGGLHGVLAEVHDKTIVLDCEGVFLEFEKVAIAKVDSATDTAASTEVESDSTDLK